MEKLLTEVHLLPEICSIIENAKSEITLVCPFMELHHSISRTLKKRGNDTDLRIKILYGKFSNGSHYKLSEKDLDFLKAFPNIDIRYNSKLHAKYYANEAFALSTSLNLNHSSHNTNLEFGFRINLTNSNIATDISNYIEQIFEESDIVFQNDRSIEIKAPKADVNYIQEIKKEHANAYERWSTEDDLQLEKLFCERKSVKELSEIFKRQPSAIRSRINKLELEEKYSF
jgi:hypothetical protein